MVLVALGRRECLATAAAAAAGGRSRDKRRYEDPKRGNDDASQGRVGGGGGRRTSLTSPNERRDGSSGTEAAAAKVAEHQGIGKSADKKFNTPKQNKMLNTQNLAVVIVELVVILVLMNALMILKEKSGLYDLRRQSRPFDGSSLLLLKCGTLQRVRLFSSCPACGAGGPCSSSS